MEKVEVERAAAFSLCAALLTRPRPLSRPLANPCACTYMWASSPGLTLSLLSLSLTCPSGPLATATTPMTEAQTVPPRTCVPVPAAWVEEGNRGSPGVTRAVVMWRSPGGVAWDTAREKEGNETARGKNARLLSLDFGFAPAVKTHATHSYASLLLLQACHGGSSSDQVGARPRFRPGRPGGDGFSVRTACGERNWLRNRPCSGARGGLAAPLCPPPCPGRMGARPVW